MIIGSVLEPAANSIVNTFIDKSHFHKQMQATQKQVTTINIFTGFGMPKSLKKSRFELKSRAAHIQLCISDSLHTI